MENDAFSNQCCAVLSKQQNRELKQQRRQRQRKGHLKINISEMVTIFCDYYFFLASFIVDRASANGQVGAPLK